MSSPYDIATEEVTPTVCGPVDEGGFLRGVDDEAVVQSGRIDALDGVRTLAVFLVVLYHLGVPGLEGGFLGVDVFFVLSGFLITTLLLRDIVRHGRIDLVRFWARRMARLFPAALVVLLAVAAWSLLAAPPYRRPGIGADLLWSLLYLGNWRFISSSSYFADDGTTSPLLHLWSLAVEEQFYFLWPLILAVVALLLANVGSGRHARRDLADARDRTTGAVMATGGLLALLSLGLMAWLWWGSGADRAYMGTDAKVFEPLIGAVFAAATLRPAVGGFVRRYAHELMVVGLGGVLLAVTTLGSPTGPQPAYFVGGAVAASLSVVALVAGATQVSPQVGLGRVFAWAPMAYLGRISYGLYLWHWPLIVWLSPVDGLSGPEAVVILLLTITAAALSYHLVELPLRSGRFRAARPARILATGFAVLLATTSVPAALGATPWYAGVGVPAWQAAGAQRDHTGPVTKLLLVGDSVPRQLYGSFADAASARGISLANATRGGCAAAGLVSVDPAGRPIDPATSAEVTPENAPCAGVVAEQSRLVEQGDPDAVLWWSRYEFADVAGPDGRPLRFGEAAYRDYQRRVLDKAVDRLAARGARVVVVRPEPTGLLTAASCTPGGPPQRTGSCADFARRLRFEDEARQQWIALLDAKAATDPRLAVVKVDDLFCRTDGNPCDDHLPLPSAPGVAGPPESIYARHDGSHFAAVAAGPVASGVLERTLEAARR